MLIKGLISRQLKSMEEEMYAHGLEYKLDQYTVHKLTRIQQGIEH